MHQTAGRKAKVSMRWLLFAALFALVNALIAIDADAAKRPTTANPYDVSHVNFPPYPPYMVYPVRIGIASRVGSARVAVWADGAVFVDNTPIFELKPGLVYLLQNGKVTEYATGRSCIWPPDKRARIASRDYRVWCNNRWWRGSLEVIQFPRSLTVINLLDLENYLCGVVPSEMPATWHSEALKAQAVAARSYAYAHLHDTPNGASKWFNSEGYDIVPDVRDQMYKGLAAETVKTNDAVKMTMGIILKDSGRVKAGFYRAWVGDAMENLNIRRKTVPSATLEKLTGVPKIVGVTVKEFTATANAHSIQIMGQKKSREVSGVALARELGLATAGILDVREEGSNWIFTYRGPGNGSRGLSQHGAESLAARGWNFEQILQQYYMDPDGRLRLDYMDKYHAIAAPPKSRHAAEQAQATNEAD